ncbi:hypothetical protein ACTXT7_012022, partial [Hymenolepis weldensis]
MLQGVLNLVSRMPNNLSLMPNADYTISTSMNAVRRQQQDAMVPLRKLAERLQVPSGDEASYKSTRSPCQFYDVNGKPFRPTLKPHPNFDVHADVDVLCKSMRCWGTDEDAIIKILGKRTNEQRMQIVSAYKAKYGRELVKDLEGDLNGHFKDCCILLTECPYYLMAKSLYYAFKGVGTNENTIIEILVGCYNEELEKLKQAYTYVLRDKGIK